jgi:hypothetical protein
VILGPVPEAIRLEPALLRCVYVVEKTQPKTSTPQAFLLLIALIPHRLF